MKQSSLSCIDDGAIEIGPLVSLVVPVYNTAEGPLRRCLRSLFMQDYRNIEFIIIDDGSNDDCVAVLNECVADEPRARIIEGSHGGVSHARNLGIEVANGEWVAFSDADDEVEPDFISDSLKVALAEGVDFVCGSLDWLYEGSVPNREEYSRDYYVFDDPCDLTAAGMQMLGHMKYKYFMGPNFKGRGPVVKLYRKSLLTDLRFDTNIVIGEDTLFNYLFIKRCQSIAVVEALWYRYYQYIGSSAHSLDIAPWVNSIDSILSSREEGETLVPFVSYGAQLTAQGVDAIFRSGSAWMSRSEGVGLLAHGYERGCFAEDCFDGYEIRVWTAAYIWLCRHRLFRIAYWFWGLKTIISESLLNKRLIDPGSVVCTN